MGLQSGNTVWQPMQRTAIDVFNYKGMIIYQLGKHDKLVWVCVVCQGNQATPQQLLPLLFCSQPSQLLTRCGAFFPHCLFAIFSFLVIFLIEFIKKESFRDPKWL